VESYLSLANLKSSLHDPRYAWVGGWRQRVSSLSAGRGWWQLEFVRLGAPDILRHLVTSPIPSLHGNALAALEQLELG